MCETTQKSKATHDMSSASARHKNLRTLIMATLVLTRRAMYKTSSSCRVPSLSYPTLHSRSTKRRNGLCDGLLLFSKNHYDQTDVRVTSPLPSQKSQYQTPCLARTRAISNTTFQSNGSPPHVLHVFLVFSLQNTRFFNMCFQHCDISKNNHTHT